LGGTTPYTVTKLGANLTVSAGAGTVNVSLDDDEATSNVTLTNSSSSLVTVTNAVTAVAGADSPFDSGDTVTLAGTGAFTLTSVNYSITDSATRTGDLTISTLSTGSSNITITEQSGSTGNTAITHNGTGTLTYTPINGGTSTVTLGASAGDITISNATAAVTINGAALTAGKRLVGGAASDSIVGGAGDDLISGGVGGDTLTGGAGNDTFYLAAADTGTFSLSLSATANATTAVWAQGTSLSIAGFDVITDFNGGIVGGTGDRLAITNAPTSATTVVRNGGVFGDNDDGVIGLILGNVVGNTFVVDVAGTSMLYVFDKDGTGAGTALGGVILVGYVDPTANDVVGSSNLLNGTAGTGLIGTGG